jgi:ApbE superfamily uncharacterized protein (UPF0280 family)
MAGERRAMKFAPIRYEANRVRGSWGAPAGAWLDGGRVHFQHGPIDLVIGAEGEPDAIGAALAAVWDRFDGLLEELVAELPQLRSPVERSGALRGPVARRMAAACRAHLPEFITPMAAVAGAVADEILGEMTEVSGLRRAYVNNGGDIAVHLAPGEGIRLGVVADPERATRHGHAFALYGTFALDASLPVRGIATSGWRGRSWSLGIADSVTVLARDAASADAAATMIANAVNVDHPSVKRAPAAAVDDNTDLGERLVTVDVGPLDGESIDRALDAGAEKTRRLVECGVVWGAALMLQGHARVVGGLKELPEFANR